MMEKNIDLHCHTTASDGKYSPSELVNLAVKNKLKAIAITDHDTIAGVDEAKKEAEGKHIEIIAGVEISCDDPGFNDTHILGLFIDYKNKELIDLLQEAQKYREEQKIEMIDRLKKLGFDVSYEGVKKISKGVIGRYFIAKVILKNNPDKVKSISEVFEKYIGFGKKAFVERKDKISIKQAIDAIHAAGGLAFIGHPGEYIYFDIRKFIDYFINQGGDGIETIYPYDKLLGSVDKDKSKELNKKFKEITIKNNLLETGGSDFHGKENQVLGKLLVHYNILQKVKINKQNRYK